jgi:tetratricopeptide (TPR) repeat protein
MTVPATLSEVAAALEEVLSDGLARTASEAVKLLQGRGLELGVKPEETVGSLLDSDELGLVMPIDDERYASLPALLAGRVFTHRVTAVEVTGGFLSTSPDLEALSLLTEDEAYQRLVDGSDVEEVLPGFDDALLLERGIQGEAVSGAAWLLSPKLFTTLGLTEGALIGVSAQPDGFAIRPVVQGEPPAGLEAALRAWASRLVDGPEQLDAVLWQLCADDPEAFTSSLPPVAELLTAAGLTWDDQLVMLPGFDLERHRVERRIERLAQLHRLDDDEALAVLVIGQLYEQVAELVGQVTDGLQEGRSFEDLADVLSLPAASPRAAASPAPPGPVDSSPERQTVRELLHLLASPAVAEAVLAETLGIERDGAAALGVFADSLEPLAPAAARPAVRWMRGRAHDRLGDPLAAEAAYEAALALDSSYPLALLELARIASDRGDAERGLSLLRRADAPADDELLAMLEHFRAGERTDIGRNEPCWCGSGRKYKVCHRNREQLPLEERAAWLYQKAGTYVQDGPWRAELLEVAQLRAEHWDDEQLPLLQALQDPLVIDAVLFEGGAFEEFLDERGVLLPEDERLLAAQWLLRERSLYEVEAVQSGSGFTARDLRTGDQLAVRERLGSRQLRPGMLLCARLVPAGDTIQCFGGLEPVELFQRDGLLALLDTEPTAADLVAFLSVRFAPPQLQNTEGEPLVLCETVLRSPDPTRLAAALDQHYRRSHDDASWHEFVTTHGAERIRATITLTGAEATVETNSNTRQDRVLSLLHELQPELQVVRESRQPAEDLREAMSRAPGRATTAGPDPSDPEVAAVLDRYVKEQERIWLDEPIPALAGATPREAALDPTRREDLVRLLDSYTAIGPGTMNPDRLRAALEL